MANFYTPLDYFCYANLLNEYARARIHTQLLTFVGTPVIMKNTFNLVRQILCSTET